MGWLYNDKELDELPEGVFGFVYKITRISDDKIYIGKKSGYSTTRRTKKVTLKSGVKKDKKVKVTKESAWRKYFGSSDELLADIKLLGEDAFKREILHFCYSKAECSYLEIKEQILHGVMETDHSYNRWVSVKTHRSHLTKATWYDTQGRDGQGND